MKYTPEGHHKYGGPPPPTSIDPAVVKYENTGSPIMSKHPYADPHQPQHRSAYDPTAQMMKFGDPMHKYHGMPPQMTNPHNDMKYRIPDGAMKPQHQYSAESLIKNPMYPDQPGVMKYPPPDSHVDLSARSTPNQDSQGSNSNFQNQLHHHGSLPSPQTRISSPLNQSPHLPPAQPTPLIMSHPGLTPQHGPGGGHIPSNHPSMMSSTSSPTVPPSQSGNIPPSSHMLPSHALAPRDLTGAPNSALMPPSVGVNIQHRPHQDIPPPMHHGAFSMAHGGPPPPSTHQQSPSPALSSVSRGDSDRERDREVRDRDRERDRDRDRDRDRERRREDSGMLHRGSPIMPGNVPPGMMGHPSMPLHLGGPPQIPPVGMPLHHPGHLGPPLLPPVPQQSSNAPLSLISHSNSAAGGGEDRRTPTALQSSSASSHTPTSTSVASSAFSRTSPSVQFASLPPSSAHRTSSPSQPPNSLTRGSPLHLSHHSSSSALSAAAAAATERDRQALMRQQSPHMTPPPVSSASMIASPLSKLYGQPQPRSMGASPPPQHHLRPGASPPVMRHPQMPLPLPMIGQPGGMPMGGMHPGHSPYSHHLIHPMFYSPHQHNPFNAPYPYHPYGPSGFPYMKPPPPGSLESSVMSHHQSVTSRCEETPTHVEKQMTISSSQSIQHKVKSYYLFYVATNLACTK